MRVSEAFRKARNKEPSELHQQVCRTEDAAKDVSGRKKDLQLSRQARIECQPVWTYGSQAILQSPRPSNPSEVLSGSILWNNPDRQPSRQSHLKPRPATLQKDDSCNLAKRRLDECQALTWSHGRCLSKRAQIPKYLCIRSQNPL